MRLQKKFVPPCVSSSYTKTYLSRRVNDAYSDYSLTVNCFVAPNCSKLKFLYSEKATKFDEIIPFF